MIVLETQNQLFEDCNSNLTFIASILLIFLKISEYTLISFYFLKSFRNKWMWVISDVKVFPYFCFPKSEFYCKINWYFSVLLFFKFTTITVASVWTYLLALLKLLDMLAYILSIFYLRRLEIPNLGAYLCSDNFRETFYILRVLRGDKNYMV